ncbi:MAG: VWA domain-containing protein [Anaerolineae bacterium]|nr:VWA domain-containing protein [Anaerolineae bacterium]MDW8098700.1 VWA domain-containing protein [Anaerolineae bacterium]
MSFLNPLAFALAALAVPIVALYFLKLQREEQVISSTYLWRTLVRDNVANAPWQRLRPNLLLLLQLMMLASLVLALARPFTWSEATTGDHLILILDTSASMQATDVLPNRLSEAAQQAQRLIEHLPATARVTIIAASDSANVLVASSTDRGSAERALRSLRAGAGGSDLSAALSLASAIAARERDPEIVILSDGNVTLPRPLPPLPSRIRYIPIGRGAATPDAVVPNQAITMLALRRTAGGQALSAFVQVTHFGSTPVARRLLLYADGQPVAARMLTLQPYQPQPLTFDDLPSDASSIEARLDGRDFLALDDAAWAVPPTPSALKVDLISRGNRFLETALALLPGLEVTRIAPEEYQVPSPAPSAVSSDLTIFDHVALPEELPGGALLILAPISSTQLFSVTGAIKQPTAIAARADEPLLRYVDLRGLQIQEAVRIPLPDWARAIITADGPDARCAPPTSASSVSSPEAVCPLLLVGQAEGRRVAVLAFDLRRSDLPLRVAFPVLLANLLDYLSIEAKAGSTPEPVRPGKPHRLPLPPDATTVTVTKPDGTAVRIEAGSGLVTFSDTTQLGIYTVEANGRFQRFAVNLFDVNESAIAPKNALPLQGAVGPESGHEVSKSRQEWWRWMAWLALALLMGEWLYAHRGELARLRAAIATMRSG